MKMNELQMHVFPFVWSGMNDKNLRNDPFIIFSFRYCVFLYMNENTIMTFQNMLNNVFMIYVKFNNANYIFVTLYGVE